MSAHSADSGINPLERPDQSSVSWLGALGRGTSGRVGVVLVGFALAIVLLGPLVAPYSPYKIATGIPVSDPSAQHWLGTDTLGRDIFSRFLAGGRTLILLPTTAVLISGVIGVALGLLGGFKGGFFDSLVTRIVDVSFSIPPLLIGMIFVAGLGSSPLVLVTIVVLLFVPRILRVVRGATQVVVGQDFVQAARARGESTAAILWREILPNISGTVLSELAIRLNYAILWIATFNFLGLGVQPPTPDWGLMVSENRAIIAQLPTGSLVPALAIAVLAIGVNLCADQLASHLAPNVLRNRRL